MDPFPAADPNLKGQPGQVVGFGEDGTAQAVRGWSNQTFVINGDFRSLTNQRGQMEYAGIGYGIDCWKSVGEPLVVTVNEGGTITISNPGTSLGYFRQTFETALPEADMTLSALVEDSDPSAYHNAMYACYDDGTFSLVTMLDSPGLYLRNVPAAAGKKVFRVQFNIAAGGSLTLKAVKLELGLTQTLAHQDAEGSWVLNDPPPDKALELVKCQRYQIALSSDLLQAVLIGTNTIFFTIPIPANLRAKPTIGIDGFKVRSLGGANQEGFTFSVFNYGYGRVTIQASKSAHGLSNAALSAGTLSLLDANP